MMQRRIAYSIRWMRSMLAVVAIILTFFILMSVFLLYSMRAGVMETNIRLNEYVQKSVDTRLVEIHNQTMAIELGQPYAYLRTGTDASDQQRLLREGYILSNTMRDNKVVNSLIAGIYFYFPSIDLVAGNLGCYTSASYYALQGMPERGGYQLWQDSLLAKHDSLYALIPNHGEDKLCYVRRMWYGDEVRCIAVVEIDADMLLEAFRQSQGDQALDECAFGVLLKGEPVAYVGSLAFAAEMENILRDRDLTEQGAFSQQDRFVFANPSNESGLNYVSIYTNRRILRPMHLALLVCAGGLALCLITGVALSIYISRRNSRPMEKLLDQVGLPAGRGVDEYQFISERIEQLMREKYESEERMQEHQILLDRLFLNTVLRGDLHSENAVFWAAKKYEVNFYLPEYRVFVISCPTADSSQQYELLDQLQRVIIEYRFEAMVTCIDQRYAVLLNQDGQSDDATEEIARTLMEKSCGGLPACVGVGARYDSMTGIVASYADALRALAETAPDAGRPVAFFTPERHRPGDSGDTQVMQNFCRMISEKEYAGAMQLTQRLYEGYLLSADPFMERLHCSAAQSILADAVYAAYPADEAVKRIQELARCASPLECKEIIEKTLANLTALPERAAQEKEPVAQRAKRIINENFTDPMMGLYMVSDQLGVSNSYLSTTFKATFGVGVIQYINKLRVEQAKSLILNTDMSIKEIALSVGFSSDINFIRVFKKLENQTPTTLRRSQQS